MFQHSNDISDSDYCMEQNDKSLEEGYNVTLMDTKIIIQNEPHLIQRSNGSASFNINLNVVEKVIFQIIIHFQIV